MMGLGLLLGALAVGALCCHSNDNVSIYKEKNRASTNTCKNYVSNYRTVYPSQVEKIEFLDDYRSLDNYLGRLIGEGSGGVGLLVNACRYQNLQNRELNYLMSDLREIRDYRNYLCHNKDKWKYLSDPKSHYSRVMSRVRSLVGYDSNNVARALYKQAAYSKSKGRY